MAQRARGADHSDHHAAACRREFFGRDHRADRPFRDQEDAGAHLQGTERVHVRREAREKREHRVARDRDREHAPSPPAIGPPHEQIRDHRAEVDERDEIAGPLRTELHVGAQVRQEQPGQEKGGQVVDGKAQFVAVRAHLAGRRLPDGRRRDGCDRGDRVDPWARCAGLGASAAADGGPAEGRGPAAGDARPRRALCHHLRRVRRPRCQQPVCRVRARKGVDNPNKENFEKVTAKSALVKAITDANEFCSNALAGASDKWLLETITQGQAPNQMQVPRAAIFAGNTSHSNEHYGNNYVAVYKRTGKDSASKQVIKPAITKVTLNKENKSAFHEAILKNKVEKLQPVFIDYEKDIQKLKMGKGVEILYTPNTENELFSLYYLSDVGTNNDPRLKVAIEYLQYIGTEEMTSEDFKKEFYTFGTHFTLD